MTPREENDFFDYLRSVVKYLRDKRENPADTQEENWLLEQGEFFLSMREREESKL